MLKFSLSLFYKDWTICKKHNFFFKKVIFGKEKKNLFSPKAKTVKIGLGGVFQTHP
jgi:hypothetical protein